MTRILVNIDRLVLNGFGAWERNALVEGLEHELARVLADPQARGQWAHSRHTPVIRLPQMPIEPGPSGGQKLGEAVARAIPQNLAMTKGPNP
jgi:hypothetical protein